MGRCHEGSVRTTSTCVQRVAPSKLLWRYVCHMPPSTHTTHTHHIHHLLQHTDMVTHVCAIPVHRVRQGTFYLHCMACQATHKAPKTYMINPAKVKTTHEYEKLAMGNALAATPGSPLIGTGNTLPPTFSSAAARRTSWAPQLSPVQEGKSAKSFRRR